jgi:uncharacterized protein (TIGR03083 family)
MSTLTFHELLTLIEDRSAALRLAAAEVALDSLVPGCPDWSVRDLVAHLGEVQRTWAYIVAAGPGAEPPDEDEVPGVEPGEDLLGWSAESTGELVRALAAAGPDQECWTWWAQAGGSAPGTAGAVARHQVQEAAVHAFDAQEAAGHGEPLPAAVAADGVEEFLTVGLASLGPWPHEPGQVALDATDAGTWVVDLDAEGAAALPPGTAAVKPGAWLRGPASDLVLTLYGRNAHGDVDIEGDSELAEQLLEWPDND